MFSVSFSEYGAQREMIFQSIVVGYQLHQRENLWQEILEFRGVACIMSNAE